MIPWFEVSANAVNAVSIGLAARNSVHTWWSGIIGCLLFGLLFFGTQLYADALLQVFFIITSAYGWWRWLKGRDGGELPVTRTAPKSLLLAFLSAVGVALSYGYLLRRFTDAYAPFVDSLVLTLSVVAQLLLMNRRYDAWWFWLSVNTLSVALFAFRGLYVTAALYAAFWINSIVALVLWRRVIT
jgi:nicotinamide mononucleotide transporter